MFIVVLEQRPLKRWTSPSQFNSIKTVLFQRQSSVELAQRVALVTAGTESVSLKSNPHSTRSTSWITFGIPFMRSDLGKTAFSALAPSTWNQLQDTFNPCGTFEVTALRSPSWVFLTPGVSTHNEAPVNAGDTPSSLSDLAGVLEVLDLPVACSDLRRRSLTTKFLSTPRSPKLSPCEPRPVLYYKLHHH